MAECRAEADRRADEWRAAPRNRLAAAVIACLWLVALGVSPGGWRGAGSRRLLKNATASAALRVILIGGRLCRMRLP